MRRVALGCSLVLLAASPAAIAQDQRFDPPAARAVVGVDMGGSSGFDRSRTTPGSGVGAPVWLGLAVAGERRVANRWWLGGSLGLSQWIQGDGLDAGYGYRRLDLGVAPRFELLRWPRRTLTTTLELALPFGLGKPFVSVPQRRAFSEQVDSAWGWYAGGTVNVTLQFLPGRRHSTTSLGVRAGIGYLRHASHRRTTFTPTDPAQARIVEDADLVDQDLVFTLAGVLGF